MPTVKVESANYYLFITGVLSEVVNATLKETEPNVISVEWIPPTSKNITDRDPGISYRVDVLNYTDQLIESKCWIIEPTFSYSLPENDRNYTFVVTPVNPVGNGSSTTLRYPQDVITGMFLIVP